MAADWTTRFLPTLYHALFCSSDPFKITVKSSAIVQTVQTVLDIIHPGNSYVVEWGSKICTTVHLTICLGHHSNLKLWSLLLRRMHGLAKSDQILEVVHKNWLINFSKRPSSLVTRIGLLGTPIGLLQRMGPHSGEYLHHRTALSPKITRILLYVNSIT